MFADDEIPEEGSVSLHVGSSEPSEPEPEKHPSDSTRPGEGEGEGGRINTDNAISQIIDTIRQASTSLSIVEEDQRPSHSVGSRTQDKSSDHESRPSNIEGMLSTMETKVSQISGHVTRVSLRQD